MSANLFVLQQGDAGMMTKTQKQWVNAVFRKLIALRVDFDEDSSIFSESGISVKFNSSPIAMEKLISNELAIQGIQFQYINRPGIQIWILTAAPVGMITIFESRLAFED